MEVYILCRCWRPQWGRSGKESYQRNKSRTVSTSKSSFRIRQVNTLKYTRLKHDVTNSEHIRTLKPYISGKLIKEELEKGAWE